MFRKRKQTNNLQRKKTKQKIDNVMILFLLTHQLPIFGDQVSLILWQHLIRHLQVPATVVKNMSSCRFVSV